MANASTDTPTSDSAIDFRPAPRPRSAASDDIDFQPASASPLVRSSRASASSGGIDFQPSEVPITPPGASIGPRTPSLLDRAKAMVTEGIPRFSTRTSSNPKFGQAQLLSPEESMTPLEQEQHPVATGVGEFAGGLTSPESAALLAGTAGAGQMAGPGAQVIKKLLAAGFSAQMLTGAMQTIPQVSDAVKRGDWPTAKRLMTHMALGAGMAGLAAHGATEEAAPTTVPRGTMPDVPLEENAPAAPPSEVQPAPPAIEPQVAKPQLVGAGDKIGDKSVAEAPATLRKQTDALASGTVPAVYFPKGTESLPAPPDNATVTNVPGEKPGSGVYYHDKSITPAQVKASVEDGTFGKLLGHEQTKAEAATGTPTNVTAWDEHGNELKSSVVDGAKPDVVEEQAKTLAKQFPEGKIGVGAPETVIAARQGSRVKPAGDVSVAPEQSAEAKSIVAPHADELRNLAAQVQHVDPHVADALSGLADGRYHTPEQLLKITGGISNAKAATDLKAIIGEYNSNESAGRTESSASSEGSRPAERTQGTEPSSEAASGAQANPVREDVGEVRNSAEGLRAAASPSGDQLAIPGNSAKVQSAPEKTPSPISRASKPKPKDAAEILREAYKPGNVVKSYMGYDKVLEFREPDSGKPYPENSWRVKVIASDKDGSPLPGERERWHTTPPEREDSAKAWRNIQERRASGKQESAREGVRTQEEMFGGSNAPKVGDNIQAKGKTLEVTKVGETGVYGREGADSPVKFVKNGEFEFVKETPKEAAPKVKNLLEKDDHNAPPSVRYSGLDPKLIKYLLPESVREKIGAEAERVGQSRRLDTGLYELDSRSAADMLRARDILREAPGTPKDLQEIYHHLEDPKGVKLNAEQQGILEKYVRPMMNATNEAYKKLNDGKEPPPGDYVHRIAAERGNMLDRILGGEGKLRSGNTLSKSAPGNKMRTMMALEDTDGNRRVVSIKSGTVTAWDNGKAEEIGKIRGLVTQGLKSKGDILDREVAPLKKELDSLEAEKRVLTSSKGRESVSGKRIENIENRQAPLREAMQDINRKDNGDWYSEADLKDRKFVDRNGKEWKLGQATTKEIEANTEVRYYKNALASATVNFLQMRRAERAYDFLEKYKNSEDFGQVAREVGKGNVPAGWRSVDLPQFRNYVFEPHTAEVLDRFAKRIKGENAPGLYDQVGNFLRTSIFFNPLIHIPNIANHWTIEKGLTGFGSPSNWGRILKTGARAIDAVIHQNDDYLDALDQGAPLQSSRLDRDAATKLIIERMGKELEGNQGYAAKIAKALGYANPLKLVRAVYDFSGRATWIFDDVARLQATYEHMDRQGIPFKEAMAEVSRHIPDYRLPTRIFDSANIGKLMSNPKLTMFGAYHYGALKSYAEMAKSLINEDVPKSEQLKSLDHLAMLGLVTFVAYPALDRLAKLVTGDKTAQLRRAGGSTFIYNLAQMARGNKSPTQVAEAVATPAIQSKVAVEAFLNHDLRTGKHIYDPGAPAKTIAKQVGRFAGQNIAPVGQALQVGEHSRSWKQQAAGLFGINTKVPTPAESLARRYASDAAGTAAPEVDTVEHHNAMRDYEDKLRNKEITVRDLAVARQRGEITLQDQQNILKRAARTPLQNGFRNLTAEQALKVWDKASDEEKQQIRPMLASKIHSIDKLPLDERADMRKKIIAALHPPAAKLNYFGIPMTPPGQ